jgi:hypothetical protein
MKYGTKSGKSSYENRPDIYTRRYFRTNFHSAAVAGSTNSHEKLFFTLISIPPLSQAAQIVMKNYFSR